MDCGECNDHILTCSFHEAINKKDLYFPSHGQRCMSCCERHILKFGKPLWGFRNQNSPLGAKTRKSIGHWLLHGYGGSLARIRCERWWRVGLSQRLCMLQVKGRGWKSIWILVGLNRDLNDVRGRILSRQPLSWSREVFWNAQGRAKVVCNVIWRRRC